RLEQFRAVGAQAVESPRLIALHKRRIAHHVGGQNSSKATLDAFSRHVTAKSFGTLAGVIVRGSRRRVYLATSAMGQMQPTIALPSSSALAQPADQVVCAVIVSVSYFSSPS